MPDQSTKQGEWRSVVDDVKHVAAVTALNHMMKKGWVDVCCIDSVAKILGVAPNRAAREVLHALHCVNFGDMPQQLRDSIPDLVSECLGVPPTYLFTTLRRVETATARPEEQTGGGLIRLLSRKVW